MARLAWIFAATVVTVATAPMACVLVDSNHFRDGTGGSSGTGATATSDECNPVTGDGCSADGSTCDVDKSGHFVCWPPPNDVAVCGACDLMTSFCSASLTCVLPQGNGEGTCYRYCCTDGDCGAGGTCDLTLGASVLSPADPSDKVGLCVSGSTAACGPGAPMSGGSCVGGYNPNAKDGGTGGKGAGGGGTGGKGAGGGGAGGGSADGGGGAPPHDGGHHDGGPHDGGGTGGGSGTGGSVSDAGNG